MNFIIALFFVLTIVNAAPTNDEVVMGDMIFLGDPKKTARNGNLNARKWENGVIPYSFDLSSGFTQAEINTIVGSMKKIEAQTNGCLTFKERTTETNWVNFKDTPTGCTSYVGKVGSGAQQVSLQKPGCIHQGVIIHELLHAAGFEHEQCRYDRDQFIRVIYNNIQPGLEFAFDKIPASVVNLFDIPYDYYSIM